VNKNKSRQSRALLSRLLSLSLSLCVIRRFIKPISTHTHTLLQTISFLLPLQKGRFEDTALLIGKVFLGQLVVLLPLRVATEALLEGSCFDGFGDGS
jgi:hypothetical protein